MRSIIWETGHRIAPFGDPPGDVRVLDQPLREHQRDALRAAGASEISVVASEAEVGEGPALVVSDDLLVGRRLISEFLLRARERTDRVSVLALEPGVFTREYAPLQDVDCSEAGAPIYPLYWVPAGVSFSSTGDSVTVEPMPTREKVYKIPVSAHLFDTDELEIPLTARPALRVRHWMHILFANRVAAAERSLRGPAWQRWLRIFWAVLRAGVPSLSRIMRRLSTRGPRCQIHPSAVVEASVIEEGARIGANAVVRFSHVGKKAMIMDGANVSFSTIGARSVVSTHCAVSFSVAYPDSLLSLSLLQLSVLGERVVTTGTGYITDMKMGGGKVKVRHHGELVSSEQRFLGAALGHRVVLGAGVWLAHGRELPNDTIIVRDPEATLVRVPEDPPRGIPLAVREGSLVPLGTPESQGSEEEPAQELE